MAAEVKGKTVAPKVVDPKTATPEQVQEALALLNKKLERQAKIQSGEIKGGKKWGELTEAEKDKFRAGNARRNAKIKLIVSKALAAGITCTDAEIDAYMAKK